jgi:hypothetical protein
VLVDRECTPLAEVRFMPAGLMSYKRMKAKADFMWALWDALSRTLPNHLECAIDPEVTAAKTALDSEA